MPTVAQRVGFIGLGIMGARMAANVARAGFPIIVWNRTEAKARAWVAEHGGVLAGSPAELAANSDIVVTMVVDAPDVEQVLLGPAGVVHGARAGTLCVDMSTIAPAATRRLGATLAEHGVRLIDAPVSGSAPRAQDGTLTIMVGGATSDVEDARPVLEAMGRLIVHVGALGEGELVKVINNAVAATNAAVIAEALVFAQRAGLDLDAMVEVMSASSGGSVMLDLKAAPMRQHDYTPLFRLGHMLKDLAICLDAGASAGAAFPFAAQTCELLTAAARAGRGDEDFAALASVVEARAGTMLH